MIRLSGLSASLPSYDREKEGLRAILAGDEYTAYGTGDEGPKGENLLLRWLNDLFERLGDLFPKLQMSDGSEHVLAYIIMGIGIVLLTVMLFFLTRLLWFERRMKRSASAEGEELDQPPPNLLARARLAADGGDMREATRLLFLSLLLSMQERELLQFKPWKTNWEYAEELSKQAVPYLGLFRESALRFDAVWYGHRECPAEEFRVWLERVEAFMAEGEGDAA